MADPTTLLEVADHEQANDLAAQTAARNKLLNAETALTDAQTQRENLAGDLQGLQQQAADIRKQLAATPMPADGEVLLEQLEQTIIDIRSTQAHLVAADATAEEARLDLETAQAELTLASTAVAVATAGRDQALKDDDQRTAWKTAVGAAPLSNLKSQATSSANAANDPLKSSKARIENDIPAQLLARARDRGAKARAEVDLARDVAEDAEDRAAQQAGADGGVAGKVAKAQVAFDRAVGELRDYVLNAIADYQRALALLTAIPSASPLTQAERDRITDTTIVNAGKAAAAKEGDRDQKRADKAAAQADLDKATLKAKSDDIDADVTAVQDVKDAQKAVDDADTALTTAEGAYTDAMKQALDKWEATVPDDAWRLLANFEEANAILQRLKSTDPAALVAAATSKEGDLVTALLNQEKSARTRLFLEDAAERTEGRLTASTNAATAKTFSAIRGDA